MSSVFIVGATIFVEAENEEEAIKKARFMIGEYQELHELWIEDEIVT